MPEIIHGLQELFEFVNETQITGKFAEEPIQICQHNIYKYSPILTLPLESGDFQLIFPETQLEIAQQLNIPGLAEIHPYEGSLPNSIHTIRAKEGLGKSHYTTIFHPSENFDIEYLLAQFYLTYVNNYNLDLWYEPLKDLTLLDPSGNPFPAIPEAVLIPLTVDQVQIISDLHEKSSFGRYLGPVMNEIRSLASEIGPSLENLPAGLKPGDKFFWKLSTRSAKDSLYYKEQNLFAALSTKNPTSKPLRKCEASTALEIVSAMVGSSRVASDCKSFLQWNVHEQTKNPLKIVIQEWVDFPAEMEFRCFVYNGKMTAINQLCWSSYIPCLDQDKVLQEKILAATLVLFDSVKSKLPWNNYILDVIYDTTRDFAQICEFNPWGPYSCTGSQLFCWELDHDIIFRENPEKPVFRILKPGMKVVGQFDLYVDSSLWEKFSEEFLQEIRNTVACPCCRKSSYPKGFKLPETKLYCPC